MKARMILNCNVILSIMTLFLPYTGRASPSGMGDVFEIAEGSHTNADAGCDAFKDDLEKALPKIQTILGITLKALENYSTIPKHIRWSIENYFVDPRLPFEGRNAYLQGEAKRNDQYGRFTILQGYVQNLLEFFEGNSDQIVYLKCSDRWMRETEYVMDPEDDEPTDEFIIDDPQLNNRSDPEIARLFPDGRRYAYWSEDFKKYLMIATDIDGQGRWKQNSRRPDGFSGACDVPIPTGREGFAVPIWSQDQGNQFDAVLTLCMETTTQPALSIYGPETTAQGLHMMSPWELMDNFAWSIIHEMLHILSFDGGHWTLNDYPQVVRPQAMLYPYAPQDQRITEMVWQPVGNVAVYTPTDCQLLGIWNPQQVTSNVNNFLWPMMACYYPLIDMSLGSIALLDHYKEKHVP